MARRSPRGDGRVDGALFAGALLVSIVALLLSESRTDAIAGRLRQTALAPLLAMQERAERSRRALTEQRSTDLLRDSLTVRALELARVDQENRALRGLLGLAAHVRWGFVPAEAVQGNPFGEPHTLVLTAGTSAGIGRYSAVIAPEGLVGYVRSASSSSSVVIAWSHPDFRVSAVVPSAGASGIVEAYATNSTELLAIRGVPYRTPLDSGAVVVSSGAGGVFPPGVPIGTVIGELPSAEGWERTYLIHPAVQASAVTSVLVLLPARVGADMTSVWNSGPTAARAAERAASAGDSLARARVDSIGRARADSTARAKADSIARVRSDSLARARADSIARARVDTVSFATPFSVPSSRAQR